MCSCVVHEHACVVAMRVHTSMYEHASATMCGGVCEYVCEVYIYSYVKLGILCSRSHLSFLHFVSVRLKNVGRMYSSHQNQGLLLRVLFMMRG